MKTIKIECLDGKWYQGQVTISYNLLNVLKVLIIALTIAALVTLAATIGYLIIKGICWVFEQMTPVFSWIADNWWWLLLSILGLLGLIWAWLKGLFRNLLKRRPKMNRPRRANKHNLWWLLFPLLLLLGVLVCWKSCGSDEKIEMPEPATTAEVYRKSFDKVIITRAYLDGVQKEVSDNCPRALVGMKYINDKSVSEYNFKGMTYQEAVNVVAEDWRPLVTDQLNPTLQLSEQQMAVVTLTAMRMGKNRFPKSTFLKEVNAGNFAAATEWLLLETFDGGILKTKDEPKQYFYMLRLLWENKIKIDNLLNLPMFSYKAIPVNVMYDKNGMHIFNENIMQKLEEGNFPTPHEALELK